MAGEGSRHLASVKVAFDASVLALAELNELSRTGVYFVIKNLLEALSKRLDIECHFFVQEGLHGYNNLTALLPKALSAVKLSGDPGAVKSWNWSRDRINFFSGFYPIRPNILAPARNSNVYQLIHDLASHTCPEFAREPRLELSRDFERWLVSGLGAVGYAFCVSKSTQADLIRCFNFHESRSTVVYPAVRGDFAARKIAAGASRQVLQQSGLPAQAQYVMALSTLEPRKNFPIILKAFRHLVESSDVPDLYLICVGAKGWGDEQSIFETLPTSVRNRIVRTGYVADEQLSDLLVDALCLVYPSLYEGFGLPPLEAMWLGVPVIVSNRGSLPEVVGDDGIVVDPQDYMRIAGVIGNWVKDPGARALSGQRARARAEQFSWEQSASKVVETMLSRTELFQPNDIGTNSKISRNQACPCGSGNRYKHCHGAFV